MLVIPQNETEEIIGTRLNELGVGIERGLELVAVREDADSATATLRDREAKIQQIQADYLIGCDGTHSAFREAIGMPFEGEDIEFTKLSSGPRMRCSPP